MEKKQRVFFFASPQQLDGISNICSWNAKNAGQSDPTEEEQDEEEEGGEQRQVRKDPQKNVSGGWREGRGRDRE